MTALSRLSKSSTLFLCEPAGAGAAALAVDIGQRRTNLTNNGTWVSESPSARTAIDAPREIAVVIDFDPATSGKTILYHGNAVSYGYQISAGSGEIIVAESGLLRVRLAVPSAGKILIAWSQRIEGSNVRDELSVYNITTSEWSHGFGSHAGTPTDPTDTLIIGAEWGGANAYNGGLASFHCVRIGQRFVSQTEYSEDFAGQTTPPAMTGRRRTPMLTGPSDELLISNQGQMAGPAYIWALAATRQHDSRTVTPLVNVVPRSPYSETNAYAPVRYFKQAPDSTLLHMSTRYLFHGFANPKTNRARVRVHARAWNITAPGSICTVYIRGYSMAHLNVKVKNPPPMPPPLVYHTTATANITAETSDGAWLDLGVVKIAREPSGLTYFALAHSFGLDTGHALEAQTLLRINAITVEPFYLEAEDDAFELSE